MRAAVIGIGSNSLRMLLADITEGRLHRIRRYREGLRLFAALDEQGNISLPMIQLACQRVAAFAAEARNGGAEVVSLFATSAVRDAKNQKQLADALQSATSLHLEICSGELEAKLSFLGATEGESVGLIDIGGGSTEIAIGQGAQIIRCVSLQMGAVRLFRMLPIVDMPTALKVAQKAGDILAPVLPSFSGFTPLKWIGVGGTFTTAAALALDIPWDDRQRTHHYPLTMNALEEIIGRLASMPVSQRLKLRSLQPQRADIAVHGMAVLLACMKGLHMDVIHVSVCGNLEGYLKMKYLPITG